MTDTPLIEKIKTQTSLYWSVFLQKSQHLIEELSDDPKGGFLWWLKTHQQKVAFDQALKKLIQDARKPEFQLNHVAELFAQFKVKKNDAGQANWYQDAHNQLIRCQQQLEEATTLKLEMINCIVLNQKATKAKV